MFGADFGENGRKRRRERAVGGGVKCDGGWEVRRLFPFQLS